MTKININDAIKYNKQSMLIPKFIKDIEIFNNLKYGDIKAQISQPRNLSHHCKIFAIATLCAFNGILDRLVDLKYISNDTLINLRQKYKDDTYILIYISKWMFLPLETEILPNGQKYDKVSSISFENMDQLDFQVFYNACINFWCEVLDITEQQLLCNLNNI